MTDLVAEKQLRAVPAFSSSAKLLVRGNDSKAYFSAARSFVETKIRKAEFDPAAFFTGNSSADDSSLNVRADAAALVLEAVRSVEPIRGVPVSTLRLRNHLPTLAKREFDLAALALREKQQVSLSLNADPHSLSQEDKDL